MLKIVDSNTKDKTFLVLDTDDGEKTPVTVDYLRDILELGLKIEGSDKALKMAKKWEKSGV